MSPSFDRLERGYGWVIDLLSWLASSEHGARRVIYRTRQACLGLSYGILAWLSMAGRLRLAEIDLHRIDMSPYIEPLVLVSFRS